MIEMIVAIAIIVLAAALAVPKMQNMTGNLRLRTAANAIKQQLLMAKTRALGDPLVHCGVYFDTVSNPDRTIVFLDDGPGTYANNDQYDAGQDHVFGLAYSMPRNISVGLGGAAGNNQVVIFRADGSAKVRGMTITVKLNGAYSRTKTVSVLPSTGRIRVQ